MFYFIIIIFLHFSISIKLSCVYVSSFLDFISILIDDQVNLGTKVHLKWELNVFSNLKYTVTKNCSLHRICTNIMDHKHHLATECSLGSSVHPINVVMSFTHSVCFSSLVKCNFIGGVESCVTGWVLFWIVDSLICFHFNVCVYFKWEDTPTGVEWHLVIDHTWQLNHWGAV